jgi:hypothetical protein
MGEAGTSLIAPTLTNAIFSATGKRLRKLPIDTTALKQRCEGNIEPKSDGRRTAWDPRLVQTGHFRQAVIPGTIPDAIPWEEDGELLRPPRVKFPDTIAIHTREQIGYFGKDGLLRRHDYGVDVLRGAQGAHYLYDYRATAKDSRYHVSS